MINFLPPALKKDLSAAKVNVILVRYIWLLAILLALVGIFIAFSMIVLQNIRSSAEAQISDNTAKTSVYAVTKNQALAFQSNLATAKEILSRQTNYSTIILDISAHLPAGVILQNISLDASSFGTPMQLQAKAASVDIANSLKDSLANSKIFSDVQFKSLATTADTTGYPINVTLEVTINKSGVTNG